MKSYILVILFLCINVFMYALAIPNDSEIISIIKITLEQNNVKSAWISDSTLVVKNTSITKVDIKEKSQEIKEEYAIRELKSDGELGSLYYADVTVFDKQQVEKMRNDGWQVSVVYFFDVTAAIEGTCSSRANTKAWNKSAFKLESTFTFRKTGKRDWDLAVWK